MLQAPSWGWSLWSASAAGASCTFVRHPSRIDLGVTLQGTRMGGCAHALPGWSGASCTLGVELHMFVAGWTSWAVIAAPPVMVLQRAWPQ